MIAQSTLISYHTEAFFKTEVDCTVVTKQRWRKVKDSDVALHLPFPKSDVAPGDTIC